MIKFKTEIRPFADLRPGDLIGTSYGFPTLERVVFEADGLVTLHFTSQQPMTYHGSNWPEVAIGFTDEYQKAYPNESFTELLACVKPA